MFILRTQFTGTFTESSVVKYLGLSQWLESLAPGLSTCATIKVNEEKQHTVDTDAHTSAYQSE